MARSATKQFKFINTPSTHDVRRIGFARNKRDASRGTLLVHYASGRIYYYADVPAHEYRRLVALEGAGFLRRCEVLWLRSIARAVVLVAPVVMRK